MWGWGCCCRDDEPNSVENNSQVEGDSKGHAINNPAIADWVTVTWEVAPKQAEQINQHLLRLFRRN